MAQRIFFRRGCENAMALHRPNLNIGERVELQSCEKCGQVNLLLRGQAQVEAMVIELNYITQPCRGAIMEIGCTGSEATKDWAFYFADICALAADEGTTEIGYLNGVSGGDALHGIDRKAGDIEWGKRRRGGSADRQGNGK